MRQVYSMSDVRDALDGMDGKNREFFNAMWCADDFASICSDALPCPYTMVGGVPKICPLPMYCRCCPYNWIDESGRITVRVADALHRAEPDGEPGPIERLVMAVEDRTDGIGRLESELDRLNLNLEND